MTDHQLHRLLVVGVDGSNARVAAHAATGQHDRDAVVGKDRRKRCVRAQVADDHSIDSTRDQRIAQGELSRWIAMGVGHDHQRLTAGRRLLNAEPEAGVEGVAGVGDDERNHAGGSFSQGSGRGASGR